MRIVIILSAVLVGFGFSELTPCICLRAEQPGRREKAPMIPFSTRADQMLWWLPVNTQTLIVKNVR